MLVLYGSQTGNAQDVAESLASEASARGIDSCALPMDCVPVEEISQQAVAIFVCSTTGQGEAPDGMKHCWRSMLRKGLPASTLADTSFAVFGLGDSGYVQFNVVAKKLDRRLEQLGGIRLIQKGLGDDQATSGYEAALDPWMASLFKALAVLFPSATGRAAEPTALRPCRFSVRIDNPDANAADSGDDFSLFRQAYHWQVVQHLEFDISTSGMTYNPGDLLTTLPHVPASTGRAFLHRIGVPPDMAVTIGISASALSGRVRARLSKAACRQQVTVPALALACGVLDVAGAPPRRPLFRCLAAYATAAAERERLAYFASAEGRDDAATYCSHERRSLLEVLRDFPSATPPLAALLEAAPLLRTRQFSLSSSPTAHSGQAHITVAEVDFRTPFRRRARGLCSSWLASLCVGDVAPVWIEQGALTLPPPQVPLICVGPGTGVAPFRSFLWERLAMIRAGTAVAPSVLIFGCRNKDKDFLYADEWEVMLREGVLRSDSGLMCAFSRDQAAKQYVQNCVRKQHQLLWKVLHACNASVFVSGSAAKMPAAVADAFVDVIAKGLRCSPEQARQLQRRLEVAKRYNVEAWS